MWAVSQQAYINIIARMFLKNIIIVSLRILLTRGRLIRRQFAENNLPISVSKVKKRLLINHYSIRIVYIYR